MEIWRLKFHTFCLLKPSKPWAFTEAFCIFLSVIGVQTIFSGKIKLTYYALCWSKCRSSHLCQLCSLMRKEIYSSLRVGNPDVHHHLPEIFCSYLSDFYYFLKYQMSKNINPYWDLQYRQFCRNFSWFAFVLIFHFMPIDYSLSYNR